MHGAQPRRVGGEFRLLCGSLSSASKVNRSKTGREGEGVWGVAMAGEPGQSEYDDEDEGDNRGEYQVL